MNRSNWYVHEVECEGSRAGNRDGVALSLHVYKRCVDEFEFVSGGEAVRGNPSNDFSGTWICQIRIPGCTRGSPTSRAPHAEAEARLKQVKTWWYFTNLNDGHDWETEDDRRARGSPFAARAEAVEAALKNVLHKAALARAPTDGEGFQRRSGCASAWNFHPWERPKG